MPIVLALIVGLVAVLLISQSTTAKDIPIEAKVETSAEGYAIEVKTSPGYPVTALTKTVVADANGVARFTFPLQIAEQNPLGLQIWVDGSNLLKTHTESISLKLPAAEEAKTEPTTQK
jgi:hypothetical protein